MFEDIFVTPLNWKLCEGKDWAILCPQHQLQHQHRSGPQEVLRERVSID